MYTEEQKAQMRAEHDAWVEKDRAQRFKRLHAGNKARNAQNRVYMQMHRDFMRELMQKKK